LREDPGASAILCDVDGTLAPIAERADEAVVPEETRRVLAELGSRYRLVACVSGRRATDARHLVGVGSLLYIGNHGFELLRPGDEQARLDPALEEHEARASELASRFDTRELRALRLRIEDKGPIFAFHWRGAPDEAAAEARAREIATAAEAAGLVAHWGRKVLEVRPPVNLDKGTAVAKALAEGNCRNALYVGDDRTDLDAFAKLRELRTGARLELALCAAVASAEGPSELIDDADLVLEGPGAVQELLRTLSDG
jgi:trehalose 6-phosphate phosphatase